MGQYTTDEVYDRLAEVKQQLEKTVTTAHFDAKVAELKTAIEQGGKKPEEKKDEPKGIMDIIKGLPLVKQALDLFQQLMSALRSANPIAQMAAADLSRWSAGAVEDVAAALEVLASALAQLDPECAEILSVVPVAVAAVVERAEQAAAGASESSGGRATTVASAALRQALAAHSLTRARVHQLGGALVTVTLDASEAQALAVLLSRRDALPRQAQPGDEDGWGAGPAETAAAALAGAVQAHGTGAYARVLASGQVSAGLTSQSHRR
ncbi:hypothetical protein ACIPD2_39225 [Streptomyces griseofuscus]|uniref:hypothetical protein n=1 Tax=Streptomyces griseofuscus TaxID=146922 RepID=UPI00381D0EBD